MGTLTPEGPLVLDRPLGRRAWFRWLARPSPPGWSRVPDAHKVSAILRGVLECAWWASTRMTFGTRLNLRTEGRTSGWTSTRFSPSEGERWFGEVLVVAPGWAAATPIDCLVTV